MKDLSALFYPASVAIVGASDDRSKWGYAVAQQALRADGRRPVHLVNRRGGTILGHRAATSLTDIGEPVDLVVISVPASSFEATVDEALALGARGIVGITAGFAELGADGAARQRAIVERVQAAGAVLVGPNCLGLVDNTSQVYLSSDRFSDGSVALLSQSGNLALELELRFSGHGLGFSRFVSFGNQADVSLVDLVDDCARHDPTSAIAVYAEDFADGRGFAVAAARATGGHGKPVVLLTTGAGAASARGAASHTGALTSSSDVVGAVCRDAGIHLAHTPRELTVLLASLTTPRRATGRRTAILTDGGGHGSIAADVAERAGLEIPVLSETVQRRLARVLWAQSALANPVDLAGMGEQDPMCYADALGALLAAGEVDAVLMTGFFGGYAAATDASTGNASNMGDASMGDDAMRGGALADGELKAGAEMARLIAAAGKPVAVQSMYPASPSCRAIAAPSSGGISGAPVFGAIEDAAASLAAVTGTTGTTTTTTTATTAPGRNCTESGAAEPHPGADSRTVSAPEPRQGADFRTVSAPEPRPRADSRIVRGFAPLPPPAPAVTDVGYFGTRRLLAGAGVIFPAAREIHDAGELRAAAAELPGPYVLKALHLLHKSDAGGVATGLPDERALVDAFRAMHARLGSGSYSVEAMADLASGVELIVGVSADPRFGPVAMVGLGGVYTEVLRDVAFALAPVPPEHAARLLRSLRTAVLLAGVRGRPAVDLDAAATAIGHVTAVAAAHPEIAEIEVNPLFVSASGALALDARAMLAPTKTME